MENISDSTKNIHVLIIGPSIKNKGGIAVMTHQILENWNSNSISIKHLPTFINGLKIVKFFYTLKSLFIYLEILIFWKPDIIHVNFSTNASFYRKSIFIFFASLFSTKLILQCHAPDFDTFYENKHSVLQRFILMVLNKGNLLLVLSKQWEQYFIKLEIRISILTLYNAVSTPTIKTSNKDQLTILSLGRLGVRKGTYDILKVIPRIIERHPSVQFWFGGDGDIKRIKLLLQDEPWKDAIKILGWVRGEQKSSILNKASIFILPSYQEGLPMALIEAMSYKLPVISTNVGGIPELIEDGVNGYLIHPGDIDSLEDRINKLIQSKSLRIRMGESGYQRFLADFQISILLKKLETIYKTI